MIQIFPILVKAHPNIFLTHREKWPAHKFDRRPENIANSKCHGFTKPVRRQVFSIRHYLTFGPKHFVISSEPISASVNRLSEPLNNHNPVCTLAKNVSMLSITVNRTRASAQ